MTLMISLPADVEIKLRERARAAEKDINEYAEQLLVNEPSPPLTLAEAAEPWAKAADASEVSDDEFRSLIVQARDAVRRGRRAEPK